MWSTVLTLRPNLLLALHTAQVGRWRCRGVRQGAFHLARASLTGLIPGHGNDAFRVPPDLATVERPHTHCYLHRGHVALILDGLRSCGVTKETIATRYTSTVLANGFRKGKSPSALATPTENINLVIITIHSFNTEQRPT